MSAIFAVIDLPVIALIRLPMSAKDPEINQRVWQVIALIPSGRVCTYGEVARQAGMPGAARRVGAALRHLPAGTKIPWHRVINAQGRISIPGHSASRHTQRDRLEAEGLVFRANKTLDLRRFGWPDVNKGDT
ncbi:MAG: methylated-DNA-protein-cysteine methyltransferase-like protein [Alcanivorax sp.]|jgi:methylated-DNA-protein-cysteine methyltransferase-like protein